MQCHLCGRARRAGKLCRLHEALWSPSYHPSHAVGGGASVACCAFMDALEREWGLTVIHRHVPLCHRVDPWVGGEVQFGPYRVDGWCPERRWVVEYHGEHWHRNRRTYDQARLAYLRSLPQVDRVCEVWHADWQRAYTETETHVAAPRPSSLLRTEPPD